MQKSVTIAIGFLILINTCCQPVSTQLDCGNQICPLSRHNIAVAEDLMKTVNEMLEEAKRQGIFTAEEEVLLEEAYESIEKAKNFSLLSQNCTAGNFYAIKSQILLKKIKKMVESKLNALQKEEYAVYSALIKTEYTQGLFYDGHKYVLGPLRYIVMEDNTSYYASGGDLNGTLHYVSEKMLAVQKETMDNFQMRNTQSYPLVDLFDLDVTVVFLNKAEVEKHFRESAWFGLYSRYPFSQGVMTLSRVGFNREMNQALVYLGNEKEILDGVGYYTLLVKENGTWVIQDKVLVWIS